MKLTLRIDHGSRGVSREEDETALKKKMCMKQKTKWKGVVSTAHRYRKRRKSHFGSLQRRKTFW